MGINSTLIIQITFVLSGILLTGRLFLGIKYTLTPTLGSLVVRFISSVIGGLGSLVGAVVGAMLLGIAEAICLNIWFRLGINRHLQLCCCSC